jgi:hypothetical protein
LSTASWYIIEGKEFMHSHGLLFLSQSIQGLQCAPQNHESWGHTSCMTKTQGKKCEVLNIAWEELGGMQVWWFLSINACNEYVSFLLKKLPNAHNLLILCTLLDWVDDLCNLVANVWGTMCKEKRTEDDKNLIDVSCLVSSFFFYS